MRTLSTKMLKEHGVGEAGFFESGGEGGETTWVERSFGKLTLIVGSLRGT
jgi:hypothetical protein